MKNLTRILVVDDELAILRLFAMILRSEGYEVQETSSGWQALDLASRTHPDLILLDVNLPDLNGIEVCKRIKANANLTDVFVVLISGQATSGADKAGGLEIGADDYITKPVDAAEFRARIRTFVRLHNAAAALRASEQHYRQLTEILPHAVVVLDLQDRLTAVNAEAVSMFGYASAAELVEKTACELVVPEECERLRETLTKTLKGESAKNDEYTMVKRHAGNFPAELRTVVLKNELAEPLGQIIVVRDLTERRQSEEQIRLLAYAVQTAREMICITDRENRFTFVNQAFLDACGYDKNEVIGNTPHFLYPPSNPPGLCEHIHQRTLAGGWKGELFNCRKDGTEFPISLNTAQIKNRDGMILGLIGVARDITVQKQAEEELRGLPRRIIEAQEAERLRVARELHDGVNQLIASVKMRIHKAADALITSSPGAEGVLARCDQLLMKALEENRRIAHNLHPSDLSNLGLATACRNLCEELSTRTDLVVRCRIASTLKRLPATCELHLFRILQEAINNIEKHARATTVQVIITLRRDLIVLRIRDDGRGFDLKRYLAGKKKNRGVGLTNMRERAASLHGICEVASAPGKGTTVTARLPRDATD